MLAYLPLPLHVGLPTTATSCLPTYHCHFVLAYLLLPLLVGLPITATSCLPTYHCHFVLAYLPPPLRVGVHSYSMHTRSVILSLSRAKLNPVYLKPRTSGGVVHGPTNMRKYDFALPKKIRAAGLRAALTIKYLQGHLTIVNEVKNATHRTNPIAHKLEQRGHHKGNTVLVVCGDTMGRELQLATLNIPYAHFMSYKGSSDVCNIHV
ncbi:hypothetical protein SARC_06551 [Sphaeroforma arctica JP610]|uniref:Large ribosomal subunit protein uL4m n=1 Tax=Sphaeroforma arctica JP610 TaxID=667725 RepID=A0A0L0FWD7_9EUKA|nr:hypothetical protein SARC_06551 [Sphaeroforma arctica JP610]KNC81127.1 hypothetical protein SARC_06551 [Sphaeroforma arctica JP610]|eukprot:XP_014155029.1 hypothetical protein SARC_06551 [Sphaeroforma arctica JP610]